MKCPNCQADNPAGSKFCQTCGQPLEEPKAKAPAKICPNCGAKNKATNAFCENCGQALDKKEAPTPKVEKSAPIPPQQPPLSRTQQRANGVPMPPAPKRSNPAGIIFLIIFLIFILGGGGYLAYAKFMQAPKQETTAAKKMSQTSSTSKASSTSSSSSEASSSSKKEPVSKFDEAKVQQIVANAMDSVSGDKTVYIAPVSEDKDYLLNNQTQSAASVIKLFILGAAYAQEKIGTIDLNDTYTLSDADKVGGTGVIQNMPAGKTFTYRELLAYMIDESDNTAANIMIDALGGLDKVNAQIQKMGATDTKLQRKLMDTDSLKAGKDNITSASDVGVFLKKVYNKQFISKKDSQEILDILAKNQDHDKLVKDLPSQAIVYNKTGIMQNYGILNDAAIISNGKDAFVAVVMTQNGENGAEQAAMNKLGLELYNELLQ